jgi:hypothetical protein
VQQSCAKNEDSSTADVTCATTRWRSSSSGLQ